MIWLIFRVDWKSLWKLYQVKKYQVYVFRILISRFLTPWHNSDQPIYQVTGVFLTSSILCLQFTQAF